MPEILQDRQTFSLLEVTRSVQKTLSVRYQSSFWVKAEMNKLNHYSHSGHSYPELVEKKDGQVIAQVKSVLWRTDYLEINEKFIRVLKEPLKDGIKILLEARILFDPVHGLSLHILDIDPGYTLGDLEMEKQQSISRLQAKGIFTRNKGLSLPLLPQRIAIISVETSKGYADFLKVLEENPWNYTFFHLLFPSLLQGEKAVKGIINQLERVRKVAKHFDVVAIIRGGGGDVGLSVYNHFELARAIATFPLPVITGIGHATNETVSEMVAYQNAITPTKIAEFLIQKFHNFSVPVQRASEFIADSSRRLITTKNTELQQMVKSFRSATDHMVSRNLMLLENMQSTLIREAKAGLKLRNDQVSVAGERMLASTKLMVRQNHRNLDSERQNLNIHSTVQLRQNDLELSNLERNLSNLDPINVLKRGFSITLKDGKAVTRACDLRQGEILRTVFFSGEMESTVTKTESDAGK